MQYQIFAIPIQDSSRSSATEELNAFLRSRRVLNVQREFVSSNLFCGWTFCIEYLENSNGVASAKSSVTKIDYRNVLSEEAFALFRILRECRKQVAEEEAVPPFAVFLDEQLAEMTKIPDLNEKTLQSINGIGEKKVAKYAKRFLELLKEKKHEAGQPPIS